MSQPYCVEVQLSLKFSRSLIKVTIDVNYYNLGEAGRSEWSAGRSNDELDMATVHGMPRGSVGLLAATLRMHFNYSKTTIGFPITALWHPFESHMSPLYVMDLG